MNLIAHALSHAKSGMRFDANGEDFIVAPLGGGNDGIGRRSEDDPNLVIGVDVRNLKEQPGGISGTLQSKKSGGYSLNYTNPILTHTLKAEGADASEDGTGRGVPMITDSAPTLRGFGHGWQGQHNDDASKMGMVRRLTPTETELLQGFPPGHTCLCGVEPYSTMTCRCHDSARYRAMGNAVTIPVIEWIGRRLLAAAGAPR